MLIFYTWTSVLSTPGHNIYIYLLVLGAAGAEPARGAVQGPAAGGGQRQGLPRAQGEDQEGEQQTVIVDIMCQIMFI